MKNKILITFVILFTILSLVSLSFSQSTIDKLEEIGIFDGQDIVDENDYVKIGQLAEIIYNVIEYTREQEFNINKNIFQKVQSSVKIECITIDGINVGSGVLIENDIVLTAYHIVKNSFDETCVVSFYDKTTTIGKLCYIDGDKDLALIKIDIDGRLPSIQLSETNPSVLDNFYSIGNPSYLDDIFVKGTISNTSVNLNNYKCELVATNSNFNSGMSGGMVLNRYGELIGIVLAKINENLGDGIGFISKLEDVDSFIEEYKKFRGD